MNQEKRKVFFEILFYVIAGVSLLVNVLLIVVLIRASNENEVLHDRVFEVEQAWHAMQEEESRKKEYIDRFTRDDEFKKRVARERLNYVGPGEMIFRFENEDKLKRQSRN